MSFENLTTETVLAQFGLKYNCAQIVFAHGACYLDLEEETALKIAACFGGGMQYGDMCGAVTGAYMAIGLKYGNYQPNDMEAKTLAMQKKGEFDEKFKALHKSLVCRNLLGLDFSKPEEAAKIPESGLTISLCPRLVADACDILDEILAND